MRSKTDWMVIEDGIYWTSTASEDPRTAAWEGAAWDGFDETKTEVTVAEFTSGPVTDLLPDNLLGLLLENIADSGSDYRDNTAEGELFNSLYGDTAQQEINTVLRNDLERWWTRYAAAFGVTATYRPTGKEMTFTVTELTEKR